MTFDERIITDAPPSAAFAYLSDLTNTASWDPSISRVEQVTPGPVGVGTFYRVTMKMLGMTTTLDYHVEVFEPDRRVIFLGRGTMTSVTDTVLVVPYRDGCRVRWTADIHLFAPLMLMDPIFGWLFRSNVRTAVMNLRYALNRLSLAHLDAAAARRGFRETHEDQARREHERDRAMPEDDVQPIHETEAHERLHEMEAHERTRERHQGDRPMHH